MNIKIQDIYIRSWNNVEKPIGIIQIIHGMGEHSKRYDNLAKFLNSHNLLVFASDHKGHGSSIKDFDELGDIKGSFNSLIDDEVTISTEIKSKYPNLPLFVIGHSMGSFMAQGHMKKISKLIDGYILSGSSYISTTQSYPGYLVSKILRKIFKNKANKIIDSIMFYGYNKHIKDPKTKFDWLTRDDTIVKRYVDDPLCGFIYKKDFYLSFFTYLSKLFNKNSFDSINRNLSLFLISGCEDPVGGYGRSIKKLINFYKEMGFANLSYILYEESRHEIFNELNNFEVFNDLINNIKHNIRV